MINFSERIQAAKPHKGFGKPPRRIVQTIYASGSDRFDGFNGTDKQLRDVATAFLQIEDIDVVLILEGSANIKDVDAADILGEYRRDAVPSGGQTLIRDQSMIQQLTKAARGATPVTMIDVDSSGTRS